MVKSNLITGQEAIDKLMEGVSLAVSAIRPSYGVNGTNAIIKEKMYPYHSVRNDAKLIVDAIFTEDKYAEIGLDMVKELMEKADKDSADGRKTTAIILDSILTKAKELGVWGNKLRDELRAFIPLIEAELDKQKTIITEDTVKDVATTASGFEWLGSLLQEIYQQIGKDGIIIPEASGTPNTSYEITEGIKFSGTGWLSASMAYDESVKEPKQAIYKKPVILVTKRKIEKDGDIAPLIEARVKDGRPLVIFTYDMDSGVASRLIATHKAKIAKILIIRASVLWKQYVFEDFAKVTGSTIVEEATGITFKGLKLEHLGTCDTLIVDKEDTIIRGGADISAHIEELKKGTDTDSKLRLSWLVTKTAVLRLGSNSESELTHLMPKCADAINSSRLALKDGVVWGGGIALVRASSVVKASVAGDIMMFALHEPAFQLATNNGGIAEIPPFNVKDSCAVLKNSVRNAIGLASTILTGGTLIHLPKEEPKVDLTKHQF